MTRLWMGVALAAVLLLTGCVGYTLAKGGKRLELGQGIAVKPARDWNRVTIDKFEYWTLDGLWLQNILFIKGVEDGDRVFPSSRRTGQDPDKDTFPKFRKGMTFLEVRELQL